MIRRAVPAATGALAAAGATAAMAFGIGGAGGVLTGGGDVSAASHGSLRLDVNGPSSRSTAWSRVRWSSAASR